MRMLRLLMLAGLLGLAGVVNGAEDAQSGGQDLPPFKKVDGNGDGQLTFKEVKDLGIAKKKFQEEDLDGDGSLSKYDYKYGIK